MKMDMAGLLRLEGQHGSCMAAMTADASSRAEGFESISHEEYTHRYSLSPCGNLIEDNSGRAWLPVRQFFRLGEGFPLAGDSGSIGTYPRSRPLRDRLVRRWTLPGAGLEHSVRGSCRWRFQSAPAMHLPLRGGDRALFIVAEYAMWLGMLIDTYGPRGATAAGLVR